MSTEQKITNFFSNKKKSGSGKKADLLPSVSPSLFEPFGEALSHGIDLKISDIVKMIIEPKHDEIETNIKKILKCIECIYGRLKEVEKEVNKNKEDDNKEEEYQQEKEEIRQLKKCTAENTSNLTKIDQELRVLRKAHKDKEAIEDNKKGDNQQEKEEIRQLKKCTAEITSNLAKIDQELCDLKKAHLEMKEKEHKTSLDSSRGTLGSEKIKTMQRIAQQNQDDYFKRTVKFRLLKGSESFKFSGDDKTPFQKAVKILSIFNADSLFLGNRVDRVTFSSDNSRFRVTYHEQCVARDVVRGLARLRNDMVRHGGLRAWWISFVIMNPKGWPDQEKALYDHGIARKKSGKTKHFHLFVLNNGLSARFINMDGSRELVHGIDLIREGQTD